MENLRRPEEKIAAPLKAIRRHCVECMGGSVIEIEKCSAPKCWLYPYRLGTDPRRGPRTEAQKHIGKLNADRLRKLNESRKGC